MLASNTTATSTDMTNPENSPTNDFSYQRLLIALIVGTAGYYLANLLPFAADANRFAPLATVAITGIIAACWLSNALPLAATSLIPLAIFPLFGIAPVAEVASAYAHPIIFMFF